MSEVKSLRHYKDIAELNANKVDDREIETRRKKDAEEIARVKACFADLEAALVNEKKNVKAKVQVQESSEQLE